MSSIRWCHPVRRGAWASVLALVVASFSSTHARGDSLDGVLRLVPDQAVAWMVSPNLSRLNADLGDLIDRADRPELAVAGRPMDVLVSQFGVAVGFDERGAFATWSPTTADLLEGRGVVAIPVEDAARFLSGNFTAEPDSGPNALRSRDGRLLFSRTLDKHVLLASDSEFLTGWKPGPGRPRLLEVYGEAIGPDIGEADIVLRIAGESVKAAQSLAADASDDTPFGGSPVDRDRLEAALESTFGGAKDILVAVNVDALALGLRGWTVYKDDSPVTRLSKTVVSDGRSVFGPLPAGPFYLAVGVDFDRFGGAAAITLFQSLAAQLEVPLDPLLKSLGEKVEAIGFVARPSKLGLAMGGILNDASLVLVGRGNASGIRDEIESAVVAMNGVTGAIERKASFKRSVEQRKGGTADEITMKAEIAPVGRRQEKARVGDASVQLTGERMLYGPRGLNGLGREIGDDYIVTFSRRPDVMARAVEAAGGVDSLAEEPMIVSILGWLPPRPGFLAMFDVGRLSGLARQVVSVIPDAAGAIPKLPESMPPIAVATTLARIGDRGRLDWGVVVPAEVIGASVGAAIAEAARPGGTRKNGNGE